MVKKLIILMVLLGASMPVFGQSVDTAWVRRYNGPANRYDEARAIAVDGHGNAYVTGRSYASGAGSDIATLKYDRNGNELWVKRFSLGINNEDGLAIAVDTFGNAYVTGYSDLGVFPYIYSDCQTIKYLSNGDTAWTRRYDGSGGDDDVARGIATDGLGNVYITGYSRGIWDADYITIKYNSTGNQLWAKRYNGPANGYDAAASVVVDSSGNVYVTGTSVGSGYYQDYLTIKYNSNGDTAWIRRYDGPGNGQDAGNAIAVDDSGSVYVTGFSDGSETGRDYATIKYKPDGDTAWVRRYGSPGDGSDEAFSIAVDDSRNIYVTGSSGTVKYDAYGNQVWHGLFGGVDMALDDSANVYVTWSIADYVTAKYDSSGDSMWIKAYNGPADLIDNPNAIAVDGSGNVYVTGYSQGSGTEYDYATVKYIQFQQRNDTLNVFAYSPVNLIVTDPIDDSIGINFNTIPGATYDTTRDMNQDGDLDDIVTIPNPILGKYLIRIVADSGGSGTYTQAVKLDGNELIVMKLNAQVPGPGQVDTVFYTVGEYLHGDANGDGKKTVSDVIFLINYLFKGGPAPNPVDLGDVNFCKQNPPVEPGQPTVADVVYLINYLFKGGPAPCS
ncbi:MAG: SBBP repeat-containing protein [Desulfobacterales bacterium]|nr:SBBP repeat-containing protein [Desulfobacterales bacterium]